jgi:hypothetical protein
MGEIVALVRPESTGRDPDGGEESANTALAEVSGRGCHWYHPALMGGWPGELARRFRPAPFGPRSLYRLLREHSITSHHAQGLMAPERSDSRTKARRASWRRWRSFSRSWNWAMHTASLDVVMGRGVGIACGRLGVRRRGRRRSFARCSPVSERLGLGGQCVAAASGFVGRWCGAGGVVLARAPWLSTVVDMAGVVNRG